jgi:hypothetical protein
MTTERANEIKALKAAAWDADILGGHDVMSVEPGPHMKALEDSLGAENAAYIDEFCGSEDLG